MENKEFIPRCLIQIRLPSEPATTERSYCLRQISDSKWSTCYYSETRDSFYYGHYFYSLEEAYVEFNTELNRQMERLSYHTEMFYKYRSYMNLSH